ncbi:MAG: hypothetical protein WA323_07575 [Candidatus Nitrosopolaris sp.]
MVDDLMTKGESMIQAMEAVRKEGVQVADVCCVIDREDPENLLNQNNITYSSLFTHSDFEEYIWRVNHPTKRNL